MTAKRKKPNDDGKKPKKPAKGLPKGDHVKVKPIRRTKEQQEEAAYFALMAWHWDILDATQQKAACMNAFEQGEAVAEEFGGPIEGATYHEMFRRSAIRSALAAKVINEVEYECWRYETQDPRIAWFRRGFIQEMESSKT